MKSHTQVAVFIDKIFTNILNGAVFCQCRNGMPCVKWITMKILRDLIMQKMTIMIMLELYPIFTCVVFLEFKSNNIGLSYIY